MKNMNKSVYSFVPRASSAFRLSSSLRAVHYRTKCFLLYRKFLEISYTIKKDRYVITCLFIVILYAIYFHSAKIFSESNVGILPANICYYYSLLTVSQVIFIQISMMFIINL